MKFLKPNKKGASKCFVLFVFLFFIQINTITAQNNNQEIISIQTKDKLITQVFDDITQKTGVKFFYGEDIASGNYKVSLSYNNKKLDEVLNSISKQTNLLFARNNNTISVTKKQETQSGKQQSAEKIKVRGTVLDNKGERVIGATIKEKGTTNGCITDLDGNFELSVSSNSTLNIHFLGYVPKDIQVGGKNQITVKLVEDNKLLDEAVVVGYGVQKKVNLTGAVGSIKTADLGDIQTNSVTSMIKGRLSGVQITQTNGKPGSGSTIRIRGVGTLGQDSKSDPLIVVDGQAVDYGIETIDPNDVESISVLKDASSASIYGSRAANGVILISTKRGIKSKGKLNVNAYVSVQSLLKDYDLLNAEEYVMLQNEARTNANMKPLFEHEPSYYGKGTDWVKEVTQLANIQEYNVNFSKGDDDSNYYVSGTLFSQDGIVKNTGYDRASFRFNSDNNILPKFKIGNSITLTWDKSYGSSVPLGNAIIAAPTMPTRFEDGTWGTGKEAGEGNPINPLYATELYKEHYTAKWRALASLYAEYQIIKELKFKVTGNIDYVNANSKNYYPRVEIFGDYNDFTDQRLVDNVSTRYTWQNDYLLYFNKEFGKHNVDAMAGMSLQASERKNNDSSVKGFLNDSEYLQILSAGQRDWRATGGLNRWSMVSFFGNVNYNYDSRYLASFNIRADGSSRFGKNNRFGYFPSGSLAWRINSEKFMEEVDWISNMKLRLSYGSLGNQEIGLYAFADQLNVNQSYIFGDGVNLIPGVTSVNLIDPNIKWETTTISNIGLDLGFLNNTISLVTEFYIKDTKDILLSYPIPSTVGKGSPTVNAGQVRNKGVEFELRYNNQFGKLWLDAAVTYGYNKNEVRKLIKEQNFITHNYSYNVVARSEVGRPMNSIYGYVMEGIYQDEADVKNSPQWSKAEPGVIKFKDLNGDNKITSDDRTYIASGMPTSTLGLNLSTKYNNFDFSMFWQGDFGKDLFWGYLGGMFPMSGMRNVYGGWLDRWTGTGTTNSMPMVKYNLEYTDVSTFHIRSADYFRLKNISLGYTFKLKNGISTRVYVAGQNLLTITPYPGFDPEINGVANWNAFGDSYPTARSYTFGLNLNF